MERKFTFGASITPILGFMIFQIGLLIVINRPSFLRDYLVPDFFDNATLDLASIILMFGGGIMIVLSLLHLIKAVPNNIVGTVYAQHIKTTQKIEELKASLSNTMALVNKEIKESKTKISCKFCGAKISADAKICPTCDRSSLT
ncbi:MAG: hypothetical protein QG670_536 [Thermoproteota archaeon]|nr:hypothetical protein [Thermoproteota archaeon]